MMSKRSVLLTVALVFGATASIKAAEDALRKWADDSGNFSVDAKLTSVSKDRSSVTLELKDGRSVVVPLSRLSTDDIRYVNRQVVATSRKKSSISSSPAIRELYGIEWYQTLDSAAATARRSTSSKPIMCFRVLGDLTGFM